MARSPGVQSAHTTCTAPSPSSAMPLGPWSPMKANASSGSSGGAGELALLTLSGLLKVAPPSFETAAQTLYGMIGGEAVRRIGSASYVRHIMPNSPFEE